MSWGYHTLIDLVDCNPGLIRSEKTIKQYVKDILSLIKMTPYSDTVCVRFGKDPAVTGYSMFQLLEESNLAGHFVEADNSACIDIFSCKEYDVVTTINFTRDYFGAKRVSYQYIERLKDGKRTAASCPLHPEIYTSSWL